MRWLVLGALVAACYQSVAIGGDAGRGDGGGDGGVPPGNVVDVGLGARFACALDDAGKIACWGDNSFGQLANGNIGGVFATPAAIPTMSTSWSKLAVGATHACAIAGSDVYCWGNGAEGQIGSAFAGSPTPMQVVGVSGAVDVAAGAASTCALDGSGTLTCWGVDDIPSLAPTALPGTWKQVSVGYQHGCGIQTDGNIACWGFCQVGYCGTATGSGTPQLYALQLGAAAPQRVIAGYDETCAIDVDSHIACGGSFDTFTDTLGTWTDIAVGAQEGFPDASVRCAVVDGDAHCWGQDALGGLGDGTWFHVGGVSQPEAVTVGSASRVVLGEAPYPVPFDYDEIGCLLDNGNLRCWGNNRSGELATTPTQQPPTAVLAPSGTWSTQIASSSTHTCAVATTGTGDQLYCWGQNDLGEVTGSAGDCNGMCGTPTLAPIAQAIDALVVGEGFTCVEQTGTIHCWGDNSHGQLGSGSSTDHGVQTLAGYSGLVGGGNGACATTGGGFACWGWYEPLGSDVIVSPPSVLTQWQAGVPTSQAVAFTAGSVCALSSSNGVQCWGNNNEGQRGAGTNGPPDEGPSSIIDASALAGFGDHYCVVDTGQHVDCWGDSIDDEAGSPTSGSVLSPQLIGSSSALGGCSAVTTGDDVSCALCDSNADVYCWGHALFGAFGQPEPAENQSTAALVPLPAAPQGRRTVAAGGNHRADHACALDNTGALTCWGMGPRGELGLGDGIHGAASPVPVVVP